MTRRLGERRTALLAHALLAAVTYIPILRSRPGIVGADTKSYLYIDPAKLLSRAPSMWDPNVGMGTLTHQNIGYLFPMGPWYWLWERVGVPDWFAQRLWLSSVMFAAGAGVLFLARTLRWRGAGPVVAALVYMLSPYVLDYSVRISVILLPWAALPWLVGLTDRALRRGGWRHPALFGLVVLAVGGVNATALVYAGLGPVLWIPFALRGRGISAGRAVATALRIGVVTAGVSLWWVAGLAVQGKFGINVLRYTETVETVAKTSLASEVLRGLGYWFFYGNDKLGPWIEPAVAYTQRLWLLGVTFALPVLALAGAALLRWRLRSYCILLIAVGTIIAVGAHPYDSPSPLGAAFKELAAGSTAGLALRSTARAVPLVVLGMALLLGATVTALGRRRPAVGAIAAVLAGCLAIAGLPPLFSGDLAIGEHLQRNESLPAYWLDAAAFLEARGHDTRVLEVPGSDFASYRWGNTVDPITPYLMDRPYVARELIPYGTAGTADLLNALDRRMQEGVFEPEALAPVARLMGVGDVVIRNDLLYERYRTPRPRVLAEQLGGDVAGLGPVKTFGPTGATRPSVARPLLDEHELGVPEAVADPSPVVVRRVLGPTPIVRAERTTGSVLMAGDGEGLVDLAAAGLLPEGSPVRYSGTLTSDAAWDRALSEAGPLVLTDTNRQRARRWGTVRENTGFTEPAGYQPLVDDPTDARLDLFPAETAANRTVVQQRGVRAVRATAYGNPISYTPEDRPAHAVDGDPTTAWRVGAFADVTGERLRLDLARPTRISSVRLVQPIGGNRRITEARLRFDRGPDVAVTLGPDSESVDGQVVSFTSRTVTNVEFEIRATDAGLHPKYDGFSGVGLAELDVAGVRVDEVVRLPTELLSRAGPRARAHPLVVVLSRQRASAADPTRGDEERSMRRTFALPDGGRTFDSLTGTARLAAGVPDDAIDRLLGRADPIAGGVIARSDSRLPGDLRSRASAAIDGDPTTAWQPGFLDQAGHWIEVESGGVVTADRLNLRVVADGRHSVPTRISVSMDDGPAQSIVLPAVADLSQRGATVAMPVSFAPLTGHRFRVTIDEVRPATTPDFFSPAFLVLPVAIADLGLPGVIAPPLSATFESACRDDLLTVDGRPTPVRVSGRTDDALAGVGLAVATCGVSAALDLSVGNHDLRATPGAATGLDLDRLVLRSEAPSPEPAARIPADPPRLDVTARGRSGFDVEVPPVTRPFWLVLGQSHNLGWHLAVDGKDAGPPVLLDGYANGWRLPAATDARSVTLRWTPQRTVDLALAASALAVLACLAIVGFTGRRDRRQRRTRPAGDESHDAPAGAETQLPSLRSRRPAPSLVALTLFSGLAFTVAAGPAVGIVVVAVGLAARFVRPLRWFAAFAPAMSLAAAGLYVTAQQARYRYPPDFAWPVNTERAHLLGLLAVGLLLASSGRAVLDRKAAGQDDGETPERD